MAAPATVSAAGVFAVNRGGSPAGDAVLRMMDAVHGSLSLGTQAWQLTGDPAKKSYLGQAAGSTLSLKIANRSELKGTVDGAPLELVREVLRPSRRRSSRSRTPARPAP